MFSRSKFLVLSLMLVVASSACKSAKKAEDTAPAPAGPVVEENTLGDSDSGKAFGLQTVRFPYDSFTLTADNKSILKGNAQVLKDRPTVKVQVEGHCDQRGGIQYNIALGEKRANAVKKYLEDMGVAGDRVTTISYGKERPVDTGTSEEAHAKNRRGNFVITSR